MTGRNKLHSINKKVVCKHSIEEKILKPLTRTQIIEHTARGIVQVHWAHLTQGEIQPRLTLGAIQECMSLSVVLKQERSTLGVIQEQEQWNLCVTHKRSNHGVIQDRKNHCEIQEHLI